MAGTADQVERRCINCERGRFIPQNIGVGDEKPVDKIQRLCFKGTVPIKERYVYANENPVCVNPPEFEPKN